MNNIKKIIICILGFLLVVVAIFVFKSKDQNIHIPKNGMIIFERQGGYLFTNDSGNLFWYNKIENKFYQINE